MIKIKQKRGRGRDNWFTLLSVNKTLKWVTDPFFFYFFFFLISTPCCPLFFFFLPDYYHFKSQDNVIYPRKKSPGKNCLMTRFQKTEKKKNRKKKIRYKKCGNFCEGLIQHAWENSRWMSPKRVFVKNDDKKKTLTSLIFPQSLPILIFFFPRFLYIYFSFKFMIILFFLLSNS